ncbi:hypothetical protein JKP88DRAFT_298663 [Tribonema minus]|uniref:Uncharacterized protein n=1 Tax=Tribonema minus TaxID=303371 RepID=A0A835ZK18_9STRA|nr:hypothetical protein JKP88DRAFT_298663 [Tribonema minus]
MMSSATTSSSNSLLSAGSSESVTGSGSGDSAGGGSGGNSAGAGASEAAEVGRSDSPPFVSALAMAATSYMLAANAASAPASIGTSDGGDGGLLALAGAANAALLSHVSQPEPTGAADAAAATKPAAGRRRGRPRRVHLPREFMSPSAATGLLGLQEHDFLVVSIQMLADSGLVRNIQPAIQELMTQQSERAAWAARCSGAASAAALYLPPAAAAAGAQHAAPLRLLPPTPHEAARAAARRCRLWTVIAGGLVMRGVRDLRASAALHTYLRHARGALRLCHDEPSDEAVRAFLCLALLHFFIEDRPRWANGAAAAYPCARAESPVAQVRDGLRFYRYLGRAERLCVELVQQQVSDDDQRLYHHELPGPEQHSRHHHNQQQQQQQQQQLSGQPASSADAHEPILLEAEVWFKLQRRSMPADDALLPSKRGATFRMYRGSLEAQLHADPALCIESMHQALGVRLMGAKLTPGADFGDMPPSNVIAAYAPDIQGLPTYNPNELLALVKESGALSKTQAKAVARSNIVAASLTRLAAADGAAAQRALVSAATNAGRDVSPAASGIDHRVIQIAHVIVNCHRTSYAAARAAGAQLLTVLERLCDGLGPQFMHTTSFDQLSMVTNMAFLHLLGADEAGCVLMLSVALRSVRDAPGCVRLPPLWSIVAYIAALLLSAGMRREYAEFAAVFNALHIAGGANALPALGDAAGQARLRDNGHVRCRAVQRILWENKKAGAAKVFVSHIKAFGDGDEQDENAADQRAARVAKTDTAAPLDHVAPPPPPLPLFPGGAGGYAAAASDADGMDDGPGDAASTGASMYDVAAGGGSELQDFAGASSAADNWAELMRMLDDGSAMSALDEGSVVAALGFDGGVQGAQ